jgi:hypothetical protein
LKEEGQDHTLWRTQFGRCYGPVTRQTTTWTCASEDKVQDVIQHEGLTLHFCFQVMALWELVAWLYWSNNLAAKICRPNSV